jgi:hypothetical protein
MRQYIFMNIHTGMIVLVHSFDFITKWEFEDGSLWLGCEVYDQGNFINIGEF